MDSNIIAKIVLILFGCFSIFCSVMNFDWFIEHRKAKLFVKMLGRNGTRILYSIVGVAIIVLAIFKM